MSAKATGYLELNITGFDQALKTAKNLMVTFAAGFTAYKIGNFFKDGVTEAVNFGKEMQSASRAMGGFDPGALLLTQKALERAGMGAEEARGHIGDFIKEGRDVADLFSGSENYAAALKSAAADYGSQADVLTRSAKILQQVWNTMESVGAKVKMFFLTMTEQFVGPLQIALDYLNSIDLATVGSNFGKAIGDAATTLFGIFKNGDTYEVVKLGLTLAFQESINWLVGGLNYIAGFSVPKISEMLLDGLMKVCEVFDKAFGEIFGSSIIDGLVGVSAKFTASLLDSINKIIKFFGAGMAMAIQAAVEKIPGLSKLIGDGGGHRSFSEMYNDAENIIPQDYIASIRDAGNELSNNAGEAWRTAASGIFRTSEDGKMEKANIFDTSTTGKKLADLIAKGSATGASLADAATAKPDPAKGVLSSFGGSGTNARVIADSLAKVGGGGGYLRVGMSLQERSALERTLAAKQTEKHTAALVEQGKQKPKQAILGR